MTISVYKIVVANYLLGCLHFLLDSLILVPLLKNTRGKEKTTETANSAKNGELIASIIINRAIDPYMLQPDISTHQGLLPPAKPL